MTTPVTLIVDVANVVGSRPDGWWRDRAAAARRLRDRVARLPGHEITVHDDGHRSLVASVVLVVEGAARPVALEPSLPDVSTVAAEGYGDDEVIRQAGTAEGRTVVVTADAQLRARARAIGVDVAGPRWLWELLDGA